jgi:NAD(P)-dependent dehydrogenase (short-subunit alcohol dehydrogenase family)
MSCPWRRSRPNNPERALIVIGSLEQHGEWLSFEGRVAVITGAGGGLGKAHALLLASRGAKVVVNDVERDDHNQASDVVDQIRSAGGQAVANGDPVGTEEAGAAVVQTAVDAFGRIDILVNNAGFVRDKSFPNMTADQFDQVIGVHLRGAFLLTQHAFRLMKEQGYGRIISTSSAAGIFGNFGQANYGSAKMGLVGMTRVLALEGARHGIASNILAPIATTPMTLPLLDEQHADRLKPELVSPVVAYLAHESCPANGEIVSAGGGRVTRIFIAEGPGYFNPDLSIESVAAHWDQVVGEQDYAVPKSLSEEIALIDSLYGAAGAP